MASSAYECHRLLVRRNAQRHPVPGGPEERHPVGAGDACRAEKASRAELDRVREEDYEMHSKTKLEELTVLHRKAVEAREAEKKAADDFRHKREFRDKAEMALEKAISASLG